LFQWKIVKIGHEIMLLKGIGVRNNTLA